MDEWMPQTTKARSFAHFNFICNQNWLFIDIIRLYPAYTKIFMPKIDKAMCALYVYNAIQVIVN